MNKIPAFFEIGPRLTKDSVIVLMHDNTLDSTTNGTGKVLDYTWLELQALRIGAGVITQKAKLFSEPYL